MVTVYSTQYKYKAHFSGEITMTLLLYNITMTMLLYNIMPRARDELSMP